MLWPSQEEPEPTAGPGQSSVLPSENERRAGVDLKATLGTPGVKARETLVAYAFTEKGDFDRLSPGASGTSDDGPAYAAELTQRLADIPMSRWTRAMVSYVIVPKSGPRAEAPVPQPAATPAGVPAKLSPAPAPRTKPTAPRGK